MSSFLGPYRFYSVNPVSTLINPFFLCHYFSGCHFIAQSCHLANFQNNVFELFTLVFTHYERSDVDNTINLKVISESVKDAGQAPTWTYQGAEPLRWVSTRDSRRIHFDPHVVFHGCGFRLARVMLPHRAFIRAHQGLAQFVLAQSGGQVVQQQQ